MAKKVILTPLAMRNYEGIVLYLLSNWGSHVANKFIARFDEVHKFLSESPKLFPFENRGKQIQKCLLTKHNMIYFREYDKVVKILTIFDTRQDPGKLSKII